MSRLAGDDAEPVLGPDGPLVETVVVPGARDLGGFEVRRALPSKGRRMVGPFWRAGRFDRVAGDAEFIPLPE